MFLLVSISRKRERKVFHFLFSLGFYYSCKLNFHKQALKESYPGAVEPMGKGKASKVESQASYLFYLSLAPCLFIFSA